MPSYSKTPKTPVPEKEGHRWLKDHNIPYEIRSDGVTVAKGNISLQNRGLICLPFVDITPWELTGSFGCSDNQLTSLRGAPHAVGRDFYCCSNQLSNLQGAPQSVGGSFHCHNNQLTSLQGAPQSVGGDFICAKNQLTSLQGAPQAVGECFDCHGNQLTCLQGAPKTVGSIFSCGDNQLTCLQGAPRTVGGDFFCGNNRLVDFSGLEHSKVKGIIRTKGNAIVSLVGLPAGVKTSGLPADIMALHRAVQGVDT